MRTIQITLVVICVVLAMVVPVVWMLGQASPAAMAFCYGSLVFVAAVGGWFLFERLRPDLLPDFLGKRFKFFLDTGTLSFMFNFESVRGVCWIVVYFQNRHEGPCQARIAITSSKRLYGVTPYFPLILVDISCPGAGFGKTGQAVGVPPEAAGREVTFDIGATVRFPAGPGRKLRYRGGIPVRHDEHFVGPSSPAQVTMEIPDQVGEFPPSNLWPRTEITWKLGDPLPAN
jgi:hypothetical protein